MSTEQQEAHRLAEMKKRYPRLKSVMTWSPREKRLRLFRVLWMRGLGPGYEGPDNYSAKLSVSIQWKFVDLWVGAFWRGDTIEREAWICLIPCVPIHFHYQRSHGGWIE